MDQLPLFTQPQTPYTVAEINAYLRDLMESDRVLQDLWVQGEVSNLSRPKSGHMYFTIKDSQASLRCVMWRSQVAALSYVPQDGDSIEVHGSISVYEAGGQYQLYADRIRPLGEGLLYQEFNRLKQKLEAEGLFDPDRKRLIPEVPRIIGIVTSPTGAALRDMLDTLRRRYPLVEVVLAPVAVQGDAAPGEIIQALNNLNEFVHPDVILVARGGGSIEDLWAFNDETVARTIAASDVPVISGVGHETDFTIADFVADLRAPTPTAAAELAVPDKVELRSGLLETFSALARAVLSLTQERKWNLQELNRRLDRSSPEGRLRTDRQRLDELIRRVGLVLGHRVQLQRTRLAGMQQQLAALSPQGVLERGYAVLTKEEGGVVRRVKDVEVGDALNVRVSDGDFSAEVKGK
ncbi:MAG: exodeoxyribonuclease VII large subunit [Anaerolineales bacterium]|jgi:exodeoxyribonuclease VII large subunit